MFRKSRPCRCEGSFDALSVFLLSLSFDLLFGCLICLLFVLLFFLAYLLQAMLEETLTKNLHLQQDLENMSQVKRTLILASVMNYVM